MIKLRGMTLGAERMFVPLTYAPQLTDRGGTATMTVRPGEEELAVGTWLLDNHEPDSGTVWRVRSAETDRSTGIVTYSLEHIIQTLEDQILPGEYAPKDIRAGATEVTARRAALFALSFQDVWQLGDVEYDLTAPFNFNRDTILDALETISSALDSPVWEFDLRTQPFTVHIRQQDTEAACELRRGRNLTKLTVRMDRGRMYTRIYPIGKNDLELPEKYISQGEENWGRVDHTATDQSIDTVNGLRIWAEGLLRRHCAPSVTVTGAGLEISQATGEPLDALRINRVCRVPDPETGNTITARIVKKQWRDKISAPESVTVTLSNDEEDVARIVNKMAKGGGGGGRADAKNAKEDHAWFVDTEEHVAMVAEAIIGQDPEHPGRVDWSRVATVIVDGNGIHNRVTAAEGEIVQQQAQIDITEGRILQEVIDRTAQDQVLSASITTVAEGVSIEAARAQAEENRLSGRIDVTAGKVALVVSEEDGQNVVNTASIVLAINDSGSSINLNADKVLMGVGQDDLATWAADAEGLIAGKATIGQLTAVSARVETIESDYVVADDISANKIRALVDGGSFSSLTTTSLVVGGISYAPNGVCKSVTATNNNGQITFTQHWMSGASTPIITFSPAASTTLAGEWSGAMYTASAKDGSGTVISTVSTTIGFHWNGSDLEVVSGNDLLLTESFTFEAHAGTSTAGGLTTINTFDASHKAYGLVSAGSLGPLRRFQVDASGEYSAGQTNGRNGVTLTKGTWSGGSIAVTASNGQSVSVSFPAVTMGQASSWDSNHKKMVYAYSNEAGIPGPVQQIEVDASSQYTAGQTNGRNGVTLSKGSWANGSIVVSASNGKSESVSFPAVTMGQDASWGSNHKKWVYAYSSAAGISGYVQRIEVDASAQFTAGVTAGEGHFSKAALTLQGAVHKVTPINNSGTVRYSSVKRYKGDGGGYWGRGVAVPNAYVKQGNVYKSAVLYAGDGVYHYDRGHEVTVLEPDSAGSVYRYGAASELTLYDPGTSYTTSNSPYYTKTT